MSEEETKKQRYLRVPISDKDHKFLSTLKPSIVKSVNGRLKQNMLILIDKLRRGVSI